ncbi:MAG: BTAD domain-containing putative transcriptional regulator [Alphaproteobacteria bacterium]
MAIYELNLLGGFDLRNPDGKSVPLSSSKAKALLAYLATCPGQSVSRSKIATLLWADRGDEQARGSLRQTLSVLRKALNDSAAEILVPSTEGLAIDSALLRTDIAAFQVFSHSDQREYLERAADLYKGPLLDGFEVREAPFEDWLRDERARLAECAVKAISTLLDLCENGGDCEAGLLFTAKLLKVDPLREDVHRVAMRLHQLSGHWNEALRQYQECKSVLATELGVAPQYETVALYEEILAQRERADRQTEALQRDSWPAIAIPRPLPLIDDGRPLIAVMPFDNLGSDPEQNYFSDGVTEDIITELSRCSGLIIIARNSTFAYKDRHFTPQEAQKAFGVHYVVKGSIRKLGNRVRVTAQLIEAKSGTQIWAERYDRELTDVFELQDDLTRGIVAVLPGRIENFEARKVVRKLPEVMAAYELLLAGKIHHHRFAKEDCITALGLLDRAIALAPDFAAAYAWKACVLGQALGRGFLPDPEALFNGAVEAASTALRLDENEVEAHRIQAEIAIETKCLSRAEYHNDRALTLNPNDPRLLAQKGELFTWLGQAEEGVGWIRMAMRLDPYSSPVWAHLLGRALMITGEYAEACEVYLKSSFPRFGYHADAAGCYAKLGLVTESASQAELALNMKPDFTVSGYVAGLAYMHDADRDHHRKILSAAPLPLGS